MSASLVFTLVPIGSIVSWSDGTPKPPERHKKKLAAWKTRNSSGRLIRTATARGLVVVLDPRLAEKSYRSTILAEMPPMRRTRPRTEAIAHLRGNDPTAQQLHDVRPHSAQQDADGST